MCKRKTPQRNKSVSISTKRKVYSYYLTSLIKKNTPTYQFLCPVLLPSVQSPPSSCANTQPTLERSCRRITENILGKLKMILFLWETIVRCCLLGVADLIKGMSWSLNCLSNKWKMEFACWTTSRKYKLAFLASDEGIAEGKRGGKKNHG